MDVPVADDEHVQWRDCVMKCPRMALYRRTDGGCAGDGVDEVGRREHEWYEHRCVSAGVREAGFGWRGICVGRAAI